MFVYEPLFFMMEHPELKVKVLYFTLEVSASEKYNEFLCHLLYRLDNIHISTTELKSTQNPVDQKILDLISSDRYKPYIDAFENMVTYIEDIKNPTGINKYCREYALSHGHYVYKKDKRADDLTGELKDVDVVDYYMPDDEEEHRIIIIDNASNLVLESGMKLNENISKMSKYNITLKNQLKYIVVLIQHQAQSQEGLDNIKMDRTYPTPDGLADCKTTIRDIDIAIGLYSPFKFGKRTFENYDITKFKNYIRFLNIMEDREYGAGGQTCPLFFDGAVSFFSELPLPNDVNNLNRVYQYIERLRGVNTLMFTLNKHFNNNLARKKIKNYFCRLFSRS